MQYRYKPLCTLVLACLPCIAQADHIHHDPALVLDTIDITHQRDALGASLTQPDLKHAREEIAQTAGGAGIVDAEQVREGRVSNFSDTLGLATGVFVQSRHGAEESRLSIRGSDDYTDLPQPSAQHLRS